MCGICGWFNYKNDAIISTSSVKKMAGILKHRGPDDEGYYISGQIGLGFKRLSIIDLGGGHQPMSDAEELVWIVFNGEIYNFLSLRTELEGYGHVFRTKSDTEVIIHGYKQWGVDVLDHLNGMFGLAIWDERNKRLMLARDRMGIKPLYYREESDKLLFASEIRSLMAYDKRKPAVDPIALYLFLRYRYTPSPFTVFQGIKKLSPGERLVIENGKSRLENWWKFQPVPFEPMPSKKEAEEKLLELYMQAIKRHLISDVPLGLLLSGGLDSGLLLALMNNYGASWKTFTVGCGTSFYADELDAASYTAKILNAENHSVTLNREIFELTLPKIIGQLEEPIGTPSVVAMYHLCQRAREDVKVVFMGQGPDELFGGYKRHLGIQYGRYWRLLPSRLHALMNVALNWMPMNETVRRGMISLHIPERMHRYQSVLSVMPSNTIDDLFQEEILPADVGDKVFYCWRNIESLMKYTDELGGFQFLEVRSSLPDELLLYADKLSMAHGLEVRLPYLDHEIVEYVERLSATFKIHYGVGKWLHRQICNKYLSKQIRQRKKFGFLYEWRESLNEKVEATLLGHNLYIYNYLRPAAVQALVKDHQNNKFDNSKILFNLFFLEEWMRNYIG